MVNGKFAIRERQTADGLATFTPPQYVMMAVYKERPTQHIIMQQHNGVFTVNNRAFGDNKTLDEVN